VKLDNVVDFIWTEELCVQLGIVMILPEHKLVKTLDAVDGIVQEPITDLFGVVVTDLSVLLQGQDLLKDSVLWERLTPGVADLTPRRETKFSTAPWITEKKVLPVYFLNI
jgi:hypothetical protein